MTAPPLEGGVYFLRSVPDPEGRNAKDRWVIVFRSVVPGHAVALCAAVSSSTTAEDRILLPNQESAPHARSGLARQSYAVPAWVLLVAHEDLADKRGTISGATLTRLREAIARASDEGRTTLQRAPDEP